VKQVVVTGGANGIGRVISQTFADEGWKVFILDVDQPTGEWVAARIRAKGHQAQFLGVELARESSISSAVSSIKGPVHALVNNAGIGHGGTLASRKLEDWNRVLAVNLTAPYLMAQHLLSKFAKPASIVNMASTRALMSEPDTEPYSASKGGILALTHSLALSLQKRRIRVNAVSPGWIDVSALHGRSAKPAKLRKIDHEQHPAGRVGKPEDVAQACLFLCDPEKSGFMTGANLVVDGGMTKKMIYEED
jgi:NAD(P)-dependent dehydrogenase (short-subunit alcohol dehydrogenase family)